MGTLGEPSISSNVPILFSCVFAGAAAEMDHEPHEPHERILHRQEVFAVQGAIFEVNRVLGSGFLEPAYQESLALELQARAIGRNF
jgi:hypothetical protein